MIVQNGILFNPGPKVKWFPWNVIFLLTCMRTSATSNAFRNINPDTIPDSTWIQRFVSSKNHSGERLEHSRGKKAAA
jgi:hypothetical protein